jgi:hypothetical protein
MRGEKSITRTGVFGVQRMCVEGKGEGKCVHRERGRPAQTTSDTYEAGKRA